MRMRVRSLASPSGLKIQRCRELCAGGRSGSDLALVGLWWRPEAAALIQALAWELPYAINRKEKKDGVRFCPKVCECVCVCVCVHTCVLLGKGDQPWGRQLLDLETRLRPLPPLVRLRPLSPTSPGSLGACALSPSPPRTSYKVHGNRAQAPPPQRDGLSQARRHSDNLPDVLRAGLGSVTCSLPGSLFLRIPRAGVSTQGLHLTAEPPPRRGAGVPTRAPGCHSPQWARLAERRLLPHQRF